MMRCQRHETTYSIQSYRKQFRVPKHNQHKRSELVPCQFSTQSIRCFQRRKKEEKKKKKKRNKHKGEIVNTMWPLCISVNLQNQNHLRFTFFCMCACKQVMDTSCL